MKALVVDSSRDFWRSTDLSSDGTKNLVEKNLVFTQKGGGNKLAADENLWNKKVGEQKIYKYHEILCVLVIGMYSFSMLPLNPGYQLCFVAGGWHANELDTEFF